MTARAIYQTHLDAVSSHLWNGDAEKVAAMLSYPHRIQLPEADRVRLDAAEQARDTEAFRESLRALGATAYHRFCREARFDPENAGHIDGVHTTYILRGATYLTDPYDCAMSILLQPDGRWLSDAIRVTVRDSRMAYYHRDELHDGPVDLIVHD